jgi:hypothetical protein
MHSCKYCGKLFRTSAGKKRHVQQTQTCSIQWREELGQFSMNVFDLEDGDAPRTVDLGSDIDCDSIPDIGDTLGSETDAYQVDMSQSPGVHVEEVAEEDGLTGTNVYYVEKYPEQGHAGAVYGKADTRFEKIKQAEVNVGGHKWGPFEDNEEWELAEWLIKNVGQGQTDAFLKLQIVRRYVCRSDVT